MKETADLPSDTAHRSTAPVISRLRCRMHAPKQAELERLFHKLPRLDDHSRAEIEQFADRLVDTMLHPLLESLLDASKSGTPTGLLEALRHLFKIDD
jgi:glutamyl-tRNA reductase